MTKEMELPADYVRTSIKRKRNLGEPLIEPKPTAQSN